MLPADQLVNWFRTMIRVRRFEEALIRLAANHDVGHFHVYIGQETTGVPALALAEPGDVMYTTHRNHGHLLARGVDPAAMMAEMLGKVTGTNRGKGGTLHLASLAHGFPTTSASVGGQLPIAVGSAFAFRQLKSDRVSICLFGEGALEEGVWHESANIAALRSLPVIFLCENNSPENVRHSSMLASSRLTDLAGTFGIKCAALDGTDARAVHLAMRRAIRRARDGDGPTFIEARTVRWPGSRPQWPELLTGETDLAMAWDPSTIPEHYGEWHRVQDGLLRFLRELLSDGVLTEERALSIDTAAREEMVAAVRFATDSPYPAPEEALDHVFA